METLNSQPPEPAWMAIKAACEGLTTRLRNNGGNLNDLLADIRDNHSKVLESGRFDELLRADVVPLDSLDMTSLRIVKLLNMKILKLLMFQRILLLVKVYILMSLILIVLIVLSCVQSMICVLNLLPLRTM